MFRVSLVPCPKETNEQKVYQLKWYFTDTDTY